jgi:hypothetical protein
MALSVASSQEREHCCACEHTTHVDRRLALDAYCTLYDEEVLTAYNILDDLLRIFISERNRNKSANGRANDHHS